MRDRDTAGKSAQARCLWPIAGHTLVAPCCRSKGSAGMRAQTSLISFLAAGIIMVAALAGGVAAPTLRLADRSATAIPVDTELVIAVDVSNSMDPEEQELQREGYI